MHSSLLELLRCPVTRSPLTIDVISKSMKKLNGIDEEIIRDGILYSREDWFYPIIDGIPRLIVEAFDDYSTFLQKHLPDYHARRTILEQKYPKLIRYVIKKNRRTKHSFSAEWNIFKYDIDKTWNLDQAGLLQQFLKEIDEEESNLPGKIIFDAGCGNGVLNQLIAGTGAVIVGMDFSLSIENAFKNNSQQRAFFIQGDVQFPPVHFEHFDIVHSSGVLHHTNNTELSFSCIEPCVRPGGKFSVWLYHPRKDFVHNTFNMARRVTSRLPIRLQYYLYMITVLPVSYIFSRIKGGKKNTREMMVDILDWLSPEFRWEHDHTEAASWFFKRNYSVAKVTTSDLFGFNITGRKTFKNEDRDI